MTLTSTCMSKTARSYTVISSDKD